MIESKMLGRREHPINRQDGFTLIELLVVILIIGILAAIAIPAFINQREKGQDTVAKSYAHTAMLAMETYGTDHDNYAATVADLVEIAPELNDGLPYLLISTSDRTYDLKVTSKTGRDFRITRDVNGVVSRTCAPIGGGSCTTGSW